MRASHRKALLSLVIVAALTSCSEPTAPDVEPAALVLSVADTLRSIGATANVTATVTNRSQERIQGAAVHGWTSSDATVVTVSPASGLLTAVANGTATISAQAGTVTATTTVVVRQRVGTVAIAGSQTIGSLGSAVQLSASATDAGGTAIVGRTIVWSSSNTAVATVNAATGVVTAIAAGSATVSATVEGTTGTRVVSVVQVPRSIALTLPTDTLRSLGATVQYTAIVKDSGGSVIPAAIVRWTSTNEAVATLDSTTGVATARTNGSLYARARVADLADSLPLVVRQRIDVTKSTLAVSRPALFAGDTLRATLQTRDALGAAIAFGGSAVTFSLSGGTSAGSFGATVDAGSGVYTSDFIASATGTAQTVGATVGGAPVTSAAPTLRVVGFTKISAFTLFSSLTCGLITTGDLYCWGDRDGGVRGTGVSSVPDAMPTLVGGGHKWSDVDVGGNAVCAIAENAKLFCWGSAVQARLGNGATNGEFTSPVAILPDASIAAVDLGTGLGACAISTAGAAFCWSEGNFGRLGDGSGSDSLAKTPVAVKGGHTFAGITTSGSSSCGVTDAGVAMCWGYAPMLGVGGGPFPDNCSGVACAKTPIQTSGGLTFKPIVVNDQSQVCAIATNGKTYCWGYFQSVPAEVQGAPIFTTIASGDLDACGVAQNGAAYCWGTNKNGRFGSPPDVNAWQLVPVLVPGGQHFVSLSMGKTHMCGVATDGNGWCWGANAVGQLGDRTTTASAVPVRVRLFAP